MRQPAPSRLFVLTALTSLAVMMLVYQRVIPPLARLLAALRTLRSGQAADTRLQGLTADFRDIAEVFNAILDDLDSRRFAEALAAADNRRVVEALDNVHSQVMLVDARISTSCISIAHCATVSAPLHPTPRQTGRSFDPQALVGVNAARFDAALSARLAAPDAERGGRLIAFASRSFQVSANAVLGTNGERLGTVLEWTDLTEQHARRIADRSHDRRGGGR